MTPTAIRYMLEDAARIHYDTRMRGAVESIVIGLQPMPVIQVHDVDVFDALEPRGTVDSLVDKTTYIRRTGTVHTPRGPVTLEVLIDTEV